MLKIKLFRIFFTSLLIAVLLLPLMSGAASKWKSLADDGIHDPESPAIGVLQEPAAALSKLPPDTSGNMVNWVKALEKGVINPRTNIRPETKVRIRNDDVFLEQTGEMPVVRFPHRAHTLWLDCKNCHEKYFISKKGANPITMMKILQGNYCGRCHGAVAFPLTECDRCHSVPWQKLDQVKAESRKAQAKYNK
ncbi:hypothetical protein MNBD_GAMMA24-2098 [hydrothermal vent metagenome]|uniref:Cytochrome c7-like domain-containing protein n=1 Tax=hydrothermal vent metagenome TaxID=652676 RepID=A0A3B1BFY0_9ZZZZ